MHFNIIMTTFPDWPAHADHMADIPSFPQSTIFAQVEEIMTIFFCRISIQAIYIFGKQTDSKKYRLGQIAAPPAQVMKPI